MTVISALLATLLSADPAVLVPGSMVPFAPAASPARVDQATTAGLSYLTATGLAWVRERQCASCHHTPEYLWTVHEARARGRAIDEPALAEIRTASFHADNRGKLFFEEGKPGAENLSLGAVYLALAELPAAPSDAEVQAMLPRIAAEIVSKQQADGSWKGALNHPPLAEPNEMATLQCVIALTSPSLADDPAKEAIATSRGRGVAWLAANPATDGLQFDLFRILLNVRLGKPAEESRPLAERIVGRQRADGGWGQSNDLQSDALATGQALYALSLAGVGPEAAAVERGRSYLVNTQSADGSWAMHSRPRGGQTSGAKNLQPIIYTGTAWATLGLVRSATTGPALARQ